MFQHGGYLEGLPKKAEQNVNVLGGAAFCSLTSFYYVFLIDYVCMCECP